jgi:anti-sigma B factor antagonist
MGFSATTRIDNNVAILDLNGNITLGEASGALRDAVKNVVAQGHRSVLLNLAGVHYIDSAGLGELVGSYATAERNEAKLKLLHLQKKVEGLMQITKLITVFEVYENEAEAVRSFASSAAKA